MTSDLLPSGIAPGRSGGDLIVMRAAAGGPAVGGPGARRGRSAVAGREGEPGATGPGCGAAGMCGVAEQVFRPVPGAGDARRRSAAGRRARGARCRSSVRRRRSLGALRRAADNPAAGRGDDGAAGVCELPGAIPDQEVDASGALAGVHQEIARCRRAPQSYNRSPSRPAGEWRVARMLGLDGGPPRPCPRINAAGTEAADPATLPRVLQLPTVNVADLAFKSVAR
jgi:hypothetical protein